MVPYFVSFTIPGKFGFTYGSHVIDLPTTPLSGLPLLDIQRSLAMDYGTSSAALITWSLLPDEDTHPSGGPPYSYFLSFVSESGAGSMIRLCHTPICSLPDLRMIEETIRSSLQAPKIHLISCIALREPTPQQLKEFQQNQLPYGSD